MSTMPNDYLSDEVINKHVNIIMTQTNYDDYYAIQKLKDFNYDHMKVIRDYMGITEKKKLTPTKGCNNTFHIEIRIRTSN